MIQYHRHQGVIQLGRYYDHMAHLVVRIAHKLLNVLARDEFFLPILLESLHHILLVVIQTSPLIRQVPQRADEIVDIFLSNYWFR